MSDESCFNCGDPATDEYDLLLRGTDHQGVPLCETCHDALQAELTNTP